MSLIFDTKSLRFTSVLCTFLLLPGDVSLLAQQPTPPAPSPAAPASPPVPAEQLDSLVAPIALYPDDLLAQVLAAATYPLEIVQLQQWLDKHKDLKDKALADAVQKQSWDPSVQGLAGLPDVVQRLAGNIQWTTELGNAFLAQQSDVMDAVQRMRSKASDAGKLKSNDQMKVETKVVENKTVVVIEQSNPQVVYVPSYDPVVVWGAPPVAYAYPPIAYPAGYYAAGMALSFGVGVAMGAMWGGGWGYHCGWGGNNSININNNNNFNRVSNRNNINGGNRISGGNRVNPLGGGNSWQHNPQHRGGTPYGDRATANRFGGSSRGDSLGGNRQASARQGLSQRGGRAGDGGSNFRSGAGGGNRGSSGLGGDRGGGLGGNRAGGGGGADRVGNRQVSNGGGSRGSGAFGGGGGFSGSGARSSSSRGSSSFGGRGGGGGGRGGGGRRR